MSVSETTGRIAGIPKLEVKNSRDVFVLFAALNAFGYDEENNAKGMSPMRKKVRKVLLEHNWNSKYLKLKRATKIYGQWRLLNAILAKSKKIKKTPAMDGFFSDFRKFSNEPAVRKLWQVVKNHQIKEAKRLFQLFEKETCRLIAFLNRPWLGIKKIVLISNPLDAYWSGYVFGIRIGFWSGLKGISYIVAGPGAKKNHGGLIRHELLHILAPALRLPRRIIAGQHRNKRLVAMGYGVSSIINREYVVRGLNLYYESVILKMDVSKAVKREEGDFPHIRETLKFIKKEKGRL